MEKKDLRAFVRAKKRAMTPAQVEAASARLAQQLFRHPAYQAARSLYGYLSYNQEVRTAAILRQAQQDGKRVAVPKVFGDEMKFLWLDDLSAVAPGAYNIPRRRSCSCRASPLTRRAIAAAMAGAFTTNISPPTRST